VPYLSGITGGIAQPYPAAIEQSVRWMHGTGHAGWHACENNLPNSLPATELMNGIIGTEGFFFSVQQKLLRTCI